MSFHVTALGKPKILPTPNLSATNAFRLDGFGHILSTSYKMLLLYHNLYRYTVCSWEAGVKLSSSYQKWKFTCWPLASRQM